jgi:hypothetical protein
MKIEHSKHSHLLSQLLALSTGALADSREKARGGKDETEDQRPAQVEDGKTERGGGDVRKARQCVFNPLPGRP